MKNIVNYSIFQLYKRKQITIITIVMVIISFCVMEYTIYDYFAIRAGKYYAKDIIPYEDDEVYRIDVGKYMTSLSEEVFEGIYCLYNEIKCVDGVLHCGFYGTNYNEDEEEGVICVYGDILELFDVKLESDRQADIDAESGIGCVWVGSELSDIYSVGDEYIFDMSTRCKVQGILPPNKRILDTSFYMYGRILDIDNMIVVQMDEIPDSEFYLPTCLDDFYFCIDKNTDIVKIKTEIYDIGQKYGIDIREIFSMEEMYSILVKELVAESGERYLLPLVMLIASVMGLIIATMISIKTNKRDSGIMIANGMTINEVSGIYIFENIIKIVIGVIISYFYCVKLLKEDGETGYMDILKLARMTYAVIVILITIISNVTVVKYFRNKMPCELIGGAND